MIGVITMDQLMVDCGPDAAVRPGDEVILLGERDGERWEALLNERDIISVPPGVYREETNVGDEDALMCVMLGTPKPITPTYPPGSALSKIKRNTTK